MDRRDAILKYISKDDLGIEIGPWFNPIAPKRDGYNCLVLDVFDTSGLRNRALADSSIASRAGDIEEVDLVGSSTEIDKIVEAKYPLGSFDYIVSSHNFEHLANPIRFLQGCAAVLQPGGMVSMAIPDHRTCFDFFRPLTMLTDWIDAFAQGRERPSLMQNFHHRAFFAYYDNGTGLSTSFLRDAPVSQVVGPTNLRAVYDELMDRINASNDEYLDTHCSAFTPGSFELLMLDCAYLRLIPFDVVEVFDAGCEFHAHLRQRASGAAMDGATHQRLRNALLHRMKDEEAETSQRYRLVAKERDELMRQRETEELVHQTESRQVQERHDSTVVELNAERTRLLNAVGDLESLVKQYQNSTFWKATGPFRWAASAVRRLGS